MMPDWKHCCKTTYEFALCAVFFVNQISRQLEYGVSKSDPKDVDPQIGFVDPDPKFIEFDPCQKQVCGRPDSNISKLTISSTNSCDESGRNMF